MQSFIKSINCAPYPRSAECLPTQRCIGLNVVFFKIYQPPFILDYSTSWLSILSLQLREGLVRLVMQFMMADIQIMYKLQIHMKFFSAGYKDGGMETALKSSRAPNNKALTEDQEGAICEYINKLDKINMYTHPQMIVGAANYLIGFKNCMANHQWLKNFLSKILSIICGNKNP